MKIWVKKPNIIKFENLLSYVKIAKETLENKETLVILKLRRINFNAIRVLLFRRC